LSPTDDGGCSERIKDPTLAAQGGKTMKPLAPTTILAVLVASVCSLAAAAAPRERDAVCPRRPQRWPRRVGQRDGLVTGSAFTGGVGKGKTVVVLVGSLVLGMDEFEGFVRQADKVLASLQFPS